jgi:steroid 5-alpha reductase family enzyme
VELPLYFCIFSMIVQEFGITVIVRKALVAQWFGDYAARARFCSNRFEPQRGGVLSTELSGLFVLSHHNNFFFFALWWSEGEGGGGGGGE